MSISDQHKALEAAANLLGRYAEADREANTTSAVRDFLLVTGLVQAEDIREEQTPEGSSGPADLTVPHKHVYVEVKRRVGTGGDSTEPDREYVEQIDGYVQGSGEPSAVGVLTDGKHWILRTPSDTPDAVRAAPYRFTIDRATRWIALFEWLRDHVFVNPALRACTRDNLRTGFGAASPLVDRHLQAIGILYEQYRLQPTVRVKRELWELLLGAALGEIRGVNLDGLFVRHTYLVAVIGMITQAAFGLDLHERAVNDPRDLIVGETFRQKTGLVDVIESDFFSWIVEVPDAAGTIRLIADHVGGYTWETDTSASLAPFLYETIIPADERKQLGEYYTPDWLAQAIVEEAVVDPLHQRVLDPACGSGAFLVQAIEHLMAAAGNAGLSPTETLHRMQRQVIGIDVHPVAVHLARAAWVMAARRPIMNGRTPDVSVPVYLGDSLQLLHEKETLLGRDEVIINVTGDRRNRQLRFPRGLVNRSETFDLIMTRAAGAIHAGEDPLVVLSDHPLTGDEHQTMADTMRILQQLHDESLDHIWAYYARNLVRPLAVSEQKADVIVGNPPWLNYNQTVAVLRDKLRTLSGTHRIWVGGRYATHQDIAGLFFTRCMDLYLTEGGACSMVLPHAALIAGHYAKWRRGEWHDSAAPSRLAADLAGADPWDLEPLTPNDFFPVPACVVHARRAAEWRPLPGRAVIWSGSPSSPVRKSGRLPVAGEHSPYANLARQGATVVPRCLFFVEAAPSDTTFTAAGTEHFNPRRGKLDKAPWKHLELTGLTGNAVEKTHMFDVLLGETVVPYGLLPPLRAVLPISPDKSRIVTRPDGSTVDPASLNHRFRGRWQEMNKLWDAHKSPNNRLSLTQQLDYRRKLSAQLEWQHNNNTRPFRVVYTSSGRPTAAIASDPKEAIVDYTLYWVSCSTLDEAHYLLGIINSTTLYDRTTPFMPKGQFGPRHVQKHLWKLPIPSYDPTNPAHTAVVSEARTAARHLTDRLDLLRASSKRPITVTTARKALRQWLATSPQGQAVEQAVTRLLS